MVDMVAAGSDREASETRDLPGRKERDLFARLAWVLRRAKCARSG